MMQLRTEILLVAAFSCLASGNSFAGALTNQTELGVVSTAGNSRSTTFHLKQENALERGPQTIKLAAATLSTTTNDILSARSWMLGFRYERTLMPPWSIYLGQEVESNRFAGFQQRYNSDLGAKGALIKRQEQTLTAEVGYRYTVENGILGEQQKHGYLRAFSEASREFRKNVSGKLAVEYLPRFSDFGDYRMNLEPSLNAMLSEILSLKVGYEVHFINRPLAGAAYKTDSVFSTALVAKF